MSSNHEAWERGYTAGHSNAMRQMSDEPGAPKSANPYPEFIPEDGDSNEFFMHDDIVDAFYKEPGA